VIYEQRVYEALPGKMAALQDRFANHTIRLFEKHGMKVVGFWTNYIGGVSNQLIYMLGYENLAERERTWAAFSADPEWQQARAESERDGPLVARTSNVILRPTRFSPMQ